MIWGGINAVEPPYTVRISGTKNLAKDVVDEISLVQRCIVEAKDEYRMRKGSDIDVRLETAP